MRDLVLMAVVVGFFALAALYVRWCDGIVGTSPADADGGAGTARGAGGDPGAVADPGAEAGPVRSAVASGEATR